jgi:hypothetical protein
MWLAHLFRELNEAAKPSRAIIAAALVLLAALLLMAVPLGSYWLSYSPYEDDFALILYSAHQYHPNFSSWITEGFAQYFANDPSCVARGYAYVRPVVNLTYFLESFLAPAPRGPHLMLTNIVCYLVSLALVFVLARRFRLGILGSGLLTFLCALSPCWYRGLLHSAFRNDAFATMWSLAAFVSALGAYGRGRRWPGLLAAGLFSVLAVATHEQAILSVGALVLLVAYREARAWRHGFPPVKALAGILLVALPAGATILLINLGNASYSHNSARGYVLACLGELVSRPEVGLWSGYLGVELVRVLTSVTPAGSGNFLCNTPGASYLVGFGVFGSMALAFYGTSKKTREAILSGTLLALHAVPSALLRPGLIEPRFYCMDVVWGLIFIGCVLTAARQSGSKFAARLAAYSLAGVLAFNVASYAMDIWARRPALARRNEVDREAFDSIRSSIAAWPKARIVIVNDQLGTWSARAMLRMAGVTAQPVDLLPTIAEEATTDFVRSLRACETAAAFRRDSRGFAVAVDCPHRCPGFLPGRVPACTEARYRQAGLLPNAAWARSVGQAHGLCCPFSHVVPLRKGETAIVVVWKDRLDPPRVSTVTRS